MKSETLTYRVVLRSQNSWGENENGSNRIYHEIDDCGHKHKSLRTALACYQRLTRRNLVYWGSGKVEDNHRCEYSFEANKRWYHIRDEHKKQFYFDLGKTRWYHWP